MRVLVHDHRRAPNPGTREPPALADGDGAITGTYEYDVFGAVRSHNGDATEFSYTGEQVDPSGVQYLRARYYEPETGRFISRDPVPHRQSYAYVGNPPCDFVDPSGLTATEGGTWTTSCHASVYANGIREKFLEHLCSPAQSGDDQCLPGVLSHRRSTVSGGHRC